MKGRIVPTSLLARVGAISILVVLLAMAVSFGAAAKKVTSGNHTAGAAPSKAEPKRESVSPVRAPFKAAARLQSPSPPAGGGVITYDCTSGTPKSDFNVGETVCAKASGAPLSTFFPWHIAWVDPAGIIEQFDLASSDPNTEYRFTLPAIDTSLVLGSLSVSNRGTWRVNLIRSNASVRFSASITVHNPDEEAVTDVFVQKLRRNAFDQIHSGENVAFIIVVGNAGPDTAQNVHLTDSAPSGATLSSFTQTSGPTCTPADQGAPSDCTIASLANGDVAEFTAVYNLGSDSPGSYSTSSSVSSTTSDPDTSNNASTALFDIQTGVSNAACELTCPSSFHVNADTTENGVRGAHVTFPGTDSTGTCGAITSSPASGSFFPVGTTVVNVSSETGDGACSFAITVDDATSGNVSISCPSEKTANADNNCQASVSVGTPTTTGDNVTVTSSRSDGKPLSDPFPTGVTSITWTAYSHDTPAPWDDEEAHRTGSAACTQTVTVNDVTPPVIVAAPQTASADASCQAVVPDFTATATVTDNCACAGDDNTEACASRSTLSVTQSPAPGTVVGLGPHTITLTANDGSSNNNGAGNTTTVTTTFTVNDTTPPTFTFVPPSVTAYTGAGASTCGTQVDPGAATASDNCSTPTISRSPSGNTFPVGSTTVTWTATDAAGNISTATQTVTVIDNTPPVISCPADITVYLPLHTPDTSMAVTYPAATASDNCGIASIGYSVPSGSVFNVGTTPVTATATDVHGNSASCTFNVTVLYDFTGFFSPVANQPTLNLVNAGRAVPVKFSLSGNKGLSIMAANSPASQQISCASDAPISTLDATTTAGSSSLSYDASSDQYNYVWKTDSSWAGQCRALVVTLNDGTQHTALFKFR